MQSVTSNSIRNVGKMDPKSKRVGTGLVGAPACGDVMKLQIEVRNSNLSRLTQNEFQFFEFRLGATFNGRR